MKTDKIKPNYKSVYTRDSLKAVDIFDAFHKLRYKIILTSYDISNDFYSTIYEIEVLNCFTAPEPLIIVSRPEDNEEPISDYGYALKLFNQYVDEYTSLVKAETRDYQDIEIYKDKFGYEETCPKCCETCKWVKRRDQKFPKHYNPLTRLECMNPKNQIEFDQNIPQRDVPPFFPEKGPVRHHETHVILVAPKVKMFGCCKNYEKFEEYVDDYVNKQNPPYPCHPHPLDPPWVRPYNYPHHCDDDVHKYCRYNKYERCPRDVQQCSDCEKRV